MAAGMRAWRHEDNWVGAPWKWYVYKFFRGDECVYVGKGSGSRIKAQAKRFAEFSGHVVACFKKEEDALLYEKTQIMELAPQLNKALMPSEPQPWRVRLMPDDKDFAAWCEAIGTREMAARILVAKGESALKQFNVDYKALISKLEHYGYCHG